MCCAVIETPLPKFFIALEKHSGVAAICETARYLTIQIFYTALQYRSILSSAGEDTLIHLFRHIEPAALPPILFYRPSSTALSPQVDVFLELVDQPQLLWMDVNYACQAGVVVSNLSHFCSNSTNCMQFLATMSTIRIPYSVPALACAALDEVVNALSMLIHGDELSPGFLRYPKPPFSAIPAERVLQGSKLLQQSDAKGSVFRIAISLCELILTLLHFCLPGLEDPRNSFAQDSKDGLVRYTVKSCIRTIHISRSFEQSPLSLATKLERTCLRILSKITFIQFPNDVTHPGTNNPSVMDLVLSEVLKDGQCSPRSCTTAIDILAFLTTDWRSDEILINNRLANSCRESFQKLGPEYSELLSMWDGYFGQTAWWHGAAQNGSVIVWEEILSRVEFWVLRGHCFYTLKWLGVMRTFLEQSAERRAAVIGLEDALRERDPALSIETWIGTLAAMLPESEIASLDEIDIIYALCQGSENGGHLTAVSSTRTELCILTILGVMDAEDFVYVKYADYLEEINLAEWSPSQRAASPSHWRGRLTPENTLNLGDDVLKSTGLGMLSAFKNGGGGKIYIQNEFRNAHGASRNTSRAPSVHVDDFNPNS